MSERESSPRPLPPIGPEPISMNAVDLGVTLKSEEDEAAPEPRAKGVCLGAPAAFKLELAARHIQDAFCRNKGKRAGQMFIVGSVLERANWRDVDIRLMLDDGAFAELFPDAGTHWDFDARWLLMNTMVSEWMSQQTGLPIDFQFQQTSHANAKHKGKRSPVGNKLVSVGDTNGNT